MSEARPATPRLNVTTAFTREAFASDDDPLCTMLLSVDVACDDDLRAAPPVSADVFLVLDVSGSMDTPQKYPLLQRAVVELLTRMAEGDRVAIAVFSTDAQIVAELTGGGEASRRAQSLVAKIDQSRLKFGGATYLGPGLAAAAQTLSASPRGRVRRVYVLTDGELHDTERCARELEAFVDLGIEVHAYGFGADFNAASLRRLFEKQLGGSVKPICNEADIIETFAHIAQVNQRLVGHGGLLSVRIDEGVDVGDAWLFRPQERLLGQVAGRLVSRELGGVEAGRRYAMMIELRLPPAPGASSTRVGEVRLAMLRGDEAVTLSSELFATRAEADGEPSPEVEQAFSVLDALRHAGDAGAERKAVAAKLSIAQAEGRDPGLIEALQKRLDVLDGKASASSLGRADEQYLDADMSSMAFVR